MPKVPETEFVWRNGKLIKWADATIHALSHVVHYGSSVFEGIRAYSTPRGPAVFRLKEHIRRLVDSAKIYHMEVPFSADELARALRQVHVEQDLLGPVSRGGVLDVPDEVAHRRSPK